jgi:hypothetical protein
VWLVVALSISLALGVLSVLPISDGLQWFIVGATTAGLIAWTWSFIVLASGSALFMLGDLGEQWTRSELDRLPKRSWRTIYHVLFRARGDVDAIAIGPGGLLVIETKWSGKGWTAPEQRRWIEAAVNQVEDSAHITELQLRSVIGPVVARRVVVLWSPADMPEEVEELRSAWVVPGTQLRTWLAALPDDQL